MLSKFFLDRPVFAWVIAIIMMLAGGPAIHNLPISQYPPIAPPSIAIDAYYSGASAETVENSVVQLIEQKMTGFDKLLYMSATSEASGAGRIELTFAPGTDPDLAWSQVQNKLQLAMASLPDSVQRQGVKVSKSTKNYLLIVSLISEDGRMDGNDLRDYAQSNIGPFFRWFNRMFGRARDKFQVMARHGKVFEDPQRQGVCVPASGGRGARSGGRVRLPVAGQGGSGAPSIDSRPQPAPWHGRAGPETDSGTPQRSGRRARVPGGRGLGEGGHPGGSPQRHP